MSLATPKSGVHFPENARTLLWIKMSGIYPSMSCQLSCKHGNTLDGWSVHHKTKLKVKCIIVFILYDSIVSFGKPVWICVWWCKWCRYDIHYLPIPVFYVYYRYCAVFNIVCLHQGFLGNYSLFISFGLWQGRKEAVKLTFDRHNDTFKTLGYPWRRVVVLHLEK